MAFIASMLLPFAACVLLAVVTAVMWWSILPSPWLYLALSLLTLLGLHRIIQLVAEAVKLLPVTSGYFLEARRDPVRFVQLAQEALTVETLIVTGVVVVAGVPLLMALRGALVRG